MSQLVMLVDGPAAGRILEVPEHDLRHEDGRRKSIDVIGPNWLVARYTFADVRPEELELRFECSDHWWEFDDWIRDDITRAVVFDPDDPCGMNQP